MIGKPGGNLKRTYEWHIEALNLDKLKRYNVECIHEKNTNNFSIKKYDIFWFYAKAFHPSLYLEIKKQRPDAKIICGPNITLDKPDVGISDEWDNWYLNYCYPDLHLDQVLFYSNHVKKFLNEKTKKVAKCLDKCLKINNNFYNKDEEKIYDCLVYSKKRRYDKNFEDFRYDLIDLLEKNNIKFCEVAAGKFGNYKREDYFDLLNKSKVLVNLSLDECPGILNYESMFFNVPVIGSKHNVPITSAPELHVTDSDYMTENYLVRPKNSAAKYFKKIVQFLNDELTLSIKNHRSWILNHTSYENYCNNVTRLIEDI